MSLGYNIPISVSVSTSSAAQSGGDFSGGDTLFDFGSGSQAGAPVYLSNSPEQNPATTANSSAALGGNATTADGGSIPVATSSGLDSTTTILIVAALGAVGAIVYFVRRKKTA